MQINTLIIIAIALLAMVFLISGTIVQAIVKKSGMSIIGRILIFSAISGLLFFIAISIVLTSI